MPSLKFFSLIALSLGFACGQSPVVSAGGVVNAASFDAPVSPGSLVSIFGSNLAAQVAAASTIPLPLSLGGVTVAFNGVAAPLLYVSSGQINAQLPWEVSATGPVNVVVMVNSAVSAPQSVSVAPVSPGIFAIQGYAVAIQPDSALAAPSGTVAQIASHAAVPGTTLVLLATGLGATNPPGVTGNNSLDTLRKANAATTVLIGNVPAQVTFAGLSPQFVGVDQINVVIPPNAPGGDAVPIQIQTGGRTSASAAIAIQGTSWTQWGQNAQHTSDVPVVGQDPNRILANILYDAVINDEKNAGSGDLLAHFQVPLNDGNDVYMEFKSGAFDGSSFSTETWYERKLTWQPNGQLTQTWSYQTDWKPPGSLHDFWEPVFHAVLANGSVYVPGANGSIVQLNKSTGALIQRFSPFGTDPHSYETGPITADSAGNLYYNVIQVVDPANGFNLNDAIDSWLVKITPAGVISMASYKALTAAEAPGANSRCFTSFAQNQLPWPPSPTAIPGTATCGTVRVGMNIAPAIAPDGTIYSVARAHFNSRYGFLVALNPDLSKKWVASLRDRFKDGCGVPVSVGGWLPPNGSPGGCRAGATLGVDPATNQFGAGLVNDSASSSPAVAPDGSILYGAFTRYNYAQGHLMHFDPNGNYLGAFGFGWDFTPAIYSHDGTWSAVVKNNHYSGTGSYCSDDTFCPPDRTATNPESPEEYFVSQLNSALQIEWSVKSTNTESCVRNSDGTVSCVSDHPAGFEWCVNAPVVDGSGVVYANSEDGNLYAIAQRGVVKKSIFQDQSLGAAYTPASLGGDGKIYSQNNGHLFVVGK